MGRRSRLGSALSATVARGYVRHREQLAICRNPRARKTCESPLIRNLNAHLRGSRFAWQGSRRRSSTSPAAPWLLAFIQWAQMTTVRAYYGGRYVRSGTLLRPAGGRWRQELTSPPPPSARRASTRGLRPAGVTLHPGGFPLQDLTATCVIAIPFGPFPHPGAVARPLFPWWICKRWWETNSLWACSESSSHVDHPNYRRLPTRKCGPPQFELRSPPHTKAVKRLARVPPR